MRSIVAKLVITLVITTVVSITVAASEYSSRQPRLIVILVVDQMRANYIDRFKHQWTAGLRRLINDGAWFRLAAHPYLNTVTCAGHATVATGTFPATHGIVANEWWDRKSAEAVTCTNDSLVTSISYDLSPSSSGHSGWRLRVPTLADELRAQLPIAPRVVTQSLKARSAIMLAGQHGDAVSWFDPSHGWTTSTAFTSAEVPFLENFFKTNSVTQDYGKSWEKTLNASNYLFPESEDGKKPDQGWTTEWPHHLNSPSGVPDQTFRSLWRHSPYSDEYLSQLAMYSVDTLKLGQGESTDYLAIGFSALDYSGHDFGPHSHEVQDILIRLDRTIGNLLDHLDRTVGLGEYVVALTADHGVSPIPEQIVKLKIDSGRIDSKSVAESVEKILAKAWGPGQFVALVKDTDLYFKSGVYEKLQADPLLLDAVINSLLAIPGIERVYRGNELDVRRITDDYSSRRAAALSYDRERSGDLIMVPQAYWLASKDAASHGTSHHYNTRVPILLMGKSIKPGEYLTEATPADIAPTLAFLTGITLTQAEGRVLTEAIASSPNSASKIITKHQAFQRAYTPEP